MGLKPSDARATPITEIYIMLEGHMDYLKKTGVFHGGPIMQDTMSKADRMKKVLDGLVKNGNL